MTRPQTLAKAAGLGARAIRLESGVTLMQVAKVARFYGLSWNSGKVGQFESGHVSPTLPTLFAVTAALSEVCETPISLADLFPGDGQIVVNDHLTVEAPRLREVLKGAAVQWESRDALADVLEHVDEFAALPRSLRPVNVDQFRAVAIDLGEPDMRMAASIGADRTTAAAAMAKLWGRTFTAERDARAGSGANAQKKGRVARDLKKEMLAVLHGDDQ